MSEATMARATNICYMRNIWRRCPRTILFQTGLVVFIVFCFVKLRSLPHQRVDTGVEKYEKRAIDIDKSSFVVDPAMPLGRIADDSLAEWISLLVKEKENRAVKNEAVIKPRDDVVFKDLRESVEVLGEGGSPRNSPKKFKFSRKEKVSNLDAGDIAVSKLIRQKLIGGSGRANVPQNEQLVAPESLYHRPKNKQLNITQTLDEPNLPQQLDTASARKNSGDMLNELVPSEPLSIELSSKHDVQTTRVNVLIVAAMRTGSSFLGELFQQRTDFFYMFEPGMLIMHKLDSLNLTRRVIYTKLIRMLHSFYHCQFNDLSFFVDLMNQKTLHARKQAVPALVTSQFCRVNHKHLLRPKDACDPVTQQALETACSTRANTAIKSIRILDINLMISAVKEPDINLRLIHLVRDPRSMILSRLKLAMPSVSIYNVTELTDTYRNILIKYCSNWLQNYEIGHYVPFMRRNYLLVRYEDLALEPHESARKIYDFVGLGAEIPANIQTWLDQNTNDNDPSKKKSAAFSTKRDSKQVLVSWKQRVTLEMARAIEEVGDCTRLMTATGYKLVGYDLSLLENDDHLVGPLPKPQLNLTAFSFLE